MLKFHQYSSNYIKINLINIKENGLKFINYKHKISVIFIRSQTINY
jgi:hypothetical protein